MVLPPPVVWPALVPVRCVVLWVVTTAVVLPVVVFRMAVELRTPVALELLP